MLSRSWGARRRLPIGAEPRARGGTHFRVWAPAARRVHVVVEGEQEAPLEQEPGGYFSGELEHVRPGMRYRFRLDDAPELLPDPASRFQPEGPAGPSEVIDPDAFAWTDAEWRGRPLRGQVIYELHVGTLTREGTWAAAMRELDELQRLGVTVLEIMPVADFPGRFGWGYDGVNLFAPTRLYGRPDDFRRFVDRAHALELSVILDVVYNHLGPDQNHLKRFSSDYFTDKYQTEWGEAIHFDGPGAEPVRELFLANARYWIDELHLDGLRLDATQCIYDSSREHMVAAVTRVVREAARDRETIVLAENEPQQARLVRPVERGGFGLDGVWNDDFHHAARVAAVGRREAYYTDYRGSAQELISTVRWGYLYQGQYYRWQKKRRGKPALDLEPWRFVDYLQNHDQVANSATGERLHQLTSPAQARALTTLLLLGPATPLLFQGQEFAASTPFLYFADHHRELAKLVKQGRGEFLAQFPSIATSGVRATLADPGEPATFERCRLPLEERHTHAPWYELHRELLRLRRQDERFAAQTRPEAAVLREDAFLLRWLDRDGDDRLLLVNLGNDLALSPLDDPLLAPPEQRRWQLIFASEDPRWGGGGAPDPFAAPESLLVPAHSSWAFAAVEEPAQGRASEDVAHG